MHSLRSAFSAIYTLLSEWAWKIYREDHLKKPINPRERGFKRCQLGAIGNAAVKDYRWSTYLDNLLKNI